MGFIWSTKFLGCWPISVEQFAVGAQEHDVTDHWTFHQPAEDSDVYSKLLRISAAVIIFSYKTLCVKNTIRPTKLNGTEQSRGPFHKLVYKMAPFH